MSQPSQFEFSFGFFFVSSLQGMSGGYPQNIFRFRPLLDHLVTQNRSLSQNMKISKITPKKSPSQYMTSFCQFWSKFHTAKAVHTFRIIPELTLPKLSKVRPSGAHFRAFFVTEGLRGSLGVFSKVLVSVVCCTTWLGVVSPYGGGPPGGRPGQRQARAGARGAVQASAQRNWATTTRSFFIFWIFDHRPLHTPISDH